MANDATVANQKQILANQRKVLANQKRIEANQRKLDQLLRNQKKLDRIIANQKRILSKLAEVAGLGLWPAISRRRSYHPRRTFLTGVKLRQRS